MSDLSSLLAPIREREAAATPLGEWETTRANDVVIYDPNGFGAYRIVAHADSKEDAAFIAAARLDIPRLLSAIDAVLALHTPYAVYEYDDMNGVFKVDDAGEQIEMKTLCRECTGDSVIELIGDCEYDELDYHDETPWPCPTVTAATAALGEQA